MNDQLTLAIVWRLLRLDDIDPAGRDENVLIIETLTDVLRHSQDMADELEQLKRPRIRTA